MADCHSAAHLTIHGRVQGVGYRFFAQDIAKRLHLTGWVRNLSDGKVEAYAEGPRIVIDEWISHLEKGPPMSRVEDIQVQWLPPESRHAAFGIL